jgi:ppGpp synthetase/RelA/SpoT-type nucleotidyltranferase
MTNELLQIQYSDCFGRANRLRETMAAQLAELMSRDLITLGVPMESRVKSWDSIRDEVERRRLSLSNIEALDDLIGIRLILLFRSELAAAERLILKFSGPPLRQHQIRDCDQGASERAFTSAPALTRRAIKACTP